jgi:hypothetical protein
VSKQNLREARRAKKQRQKLISTLVWGGVAVAVVAVFGFIIWGAVRPAQGESVPIMANSEAHVPEGQDPGPFNSDPPTSGPHYAEEYDAGFYEESSPESQVTYPEGYLGHNLEHGYVIYWYNCALLAESKCAELKKQISTSMADNGGTKLIAFPRASIDVPVVMTTWGQMQRFETFDEDLARKFVSANRNRAPEPNAP